jgi:prepilin-type N-terminal cleavage/methylation domain-containing protein
VHPVIFLATRRKQKGLTLVELLVAMSIMVVLSTMIVATWVALTNAYSFSTRSDTQRDFARQAIDRMAREIRDAQQPLGGTSPAFAGAYPDEVRFYSTFNMLLAGPDLILGTADDVTASDPKSPPRLTRFIYVVTDTQEGTGAVYRQLAELEGPDLILGTADDGFRDPVESDEPPLVSDVYNEGADKDMFTYWSYNPSGDVVPSQGIVDTSRIVEVEITLLVDLNPGKAPNYMDLSTKVQPRNVREF